MNDAEMRCVFRSGDVRSRSKDGSSASADAGPFFFFFFCATTCFHECGVGLAHCGTAAALLDKHRAQARLVEEGLECEQSARLPEDSPRVHATLPPDGVGRDGNQVAVGLPV